MTLNRSRFSGMGPRQIATLIALVIMLAVIAWQIKGLFSNNAKPPATSTTTQPALTQGAANTLAASVPQAAPVPRQAPMTPREMELMKMQQETEAKYLAAVNELQMLRIQRELAETNQAIVAAKLATVTAQKNIVNLLSPPPPPPPVPAETYSRNLGPQLPVTQPPALAVVKPATPIAPVATAANYSVVSITRIRYRWHAVLGFEGNLYNVSIGDILPPDGSKVISIDNSSVTLLRNRERKRISLVPII